MLNYLSSLILILSLEFITFKFDVTMYVLRIIYFMEQKFRTAGDFAPDQFQEGASIWLRCCEFAIDFPSKKCRAIVNRYRLSHSF